MRRITHIVIHCTATAQTATVASIAKYWREVLKWKAPGYHYIIAADGHITQLLDEKLPSNGVAGHNSHIINVCYIGGVDANGKPVDNRTMAQKAAMIGTIKEIKTRHPMAVVQGHRDFPGVKKDCPCFDAKSEYARL